MFKRIIGLLLLVLAFLAPAAAAAEREPDEYAVWLTEPPVGLQLSRSAPKGQVRAETAEVRSLAEAVEAAQRPIRGAIERMGVPVTGATRYLLNAVFVNATPEQARRLGELPGVGAVVRMRRFKRLLNASADLVNASAAWSALGGVNNAGAGLKIAILDSGIDSNHPGLQDPSLTPPPGYPRARPEHLAFTNNKIIVARNYVLPRQPLDPRFSRPDDYSPADRGGHGTFAAMVAAGRTVTAEGGPAITGIAPKAFLGNYKILGSADINDFAPESRILQAMDDAVSDGMDILNLSLGSGIAVYRPDDRGGACPGRGGNPCDALAEAVRIATEQFGMVAVAAAGNDGERGNTFPTLNTISSPATAPDAIAAGATTNSRQLYSTLRAGAGSPSSLQSVPALFGNGPRRSLTAPIRDVEALGNDGTACNPLTGGSLAGAIALVRRSGCDFEDKVLNAAAGGAAGVVVYNRSGRNEPITMTGLVNATIPAVMIGNSAGTELRSYAARSGATVTLDPQLTARSATADLVASFTSRGPGIDMAVKPDVVAPGVSIFSATQKLDPNGTEYDPTGFTTLEGTSFSAAHVSGAAALVWQRNRNLRPQQVKSAIVNTASDNVQEDGSRARATAVGAGKLNARAAITPGATVEPASVSFGVLASSTLPATRELRLTNVGSSTETFRIEVQQRDADSNGRVSVDTSSVQLGAGESRRLVVLLSGSLPRAGFYEGVIRIQGSSSGGANLRVPYHYAVASRTPANIFPIAGDGLIATAGVALFEPLLFKLVDNFGLPVPGVDVRFRVTQGGGRITLADERTDVYGIAGAEVELGREIGEQNFTATAGGLTVSFFNFSRPEPRINDGGIVNGASFARGRTVAPGSIISIFGSDLAEATRGAIRVPLPMSLYHTSVSFDHPDTGLSVAGRLFFVSPGQINVQVPWEFAGLTFAIVKVRINDTVSSTFRLELGDYAPGIFEYDAGGQKLGVVTHANGDVVTATNPARPGETVIVYATGVGLVDQAQSSGEAAPSGPLARTRQTPTVTVGGEGAAVQFSGLAPGFVGLNQLNFTIPSGARSGGQPLVITSNGIPSNTVNVPVQQ